MIIDKKLLDGGITAQLVGKLIERHRQSCGKYEKLMNYYLGVHSICNRVKQSPEAANNKIVCNHAKYIVDMAQSYLTGNPIGYSASEGVDIEPLKDAYLVQDMPSLDSGIVKYMEIYGRAYEMVYADADGEPKSTVIKPQHAFVCRSRSVDERAVLGVYYYNLFDINGNIDGSHAVVCDNENIYTFEGTSPSWDTMTLVGTEPHYFGGVPIIEYKNNAECQGDFEQLIPLIDAYNLLCSDRVNDKEQFVDAFLLLKNIDIDSDAAKKLKEEKILIGFDSDADARYLSKAMTEADIKVLRDDLKQDIHKFSMVPDLSDESFGGNLSGVAIKYKLLGFEQHIKNKERYFTRSLRKRFKLYNNFLNIKGVMAIVPPHRIDVIFTRNLPSNDAETAQMISLLSGTLTNETLIGQLSFVADAKEEAENADKEKAEREQREMSTFTGGYTSYEQP